MKYSKYSYGNEIDYSIERLTDKNYIYTQNFECGNEEIDDYLCNKALHDEFGVTYLIIDKNDSIAIGYCTICCSGITHKYQDNIRTIPAIEIRYFAIAQRLHNLEYDDTDAKYHFSDHIMANIMYECSEITEKVIAAKYILLYSVKRAINFYTRLGFNDFTKYFEPDQYRYLDGCKPMYIEIP